MRHKNIPGDFNNICFCGKEYLEKTRFARFEFKACSMKCLDKICAEKLERIREEKEARYKKKDFPCLTDGSGNTY